MLLVIACVQWNANACKKIRSDRFSKRNDCRSAFRWSHGNGNSKIFGVCKEHGISHYDTVYERRKLVSSKQNSGRNIKMTGEDRRELKCIVIRNTESNRYSSWLRKLTVIYRTLFEQKISKGLWIFPGHQLLKHRLSLSVIPVFHPLFCTEDVILPDFFFCISNCLVEDDGDSER